LLLHRRARTSLVARARLENVSLNRAAEAVLGAFDHSYQRALRLLGAPELASLADAARRNVDRIRAQLYDVVALEMRMRRDAKTLRRLHRVSAVDSALGELDRQMQSLHTESDKMALDAQRIVDRLERVRRLASSETPAQSQEALTRVLADLDATATAYEEIERDRVAAGTESAQLLRARAMRQSQSQQ